MGEVIFLGLEVELIIKISWSVLGCGNRGNRMGSGHGGYFRIWEGVTIGNMVKKVGQTRDWNMQLEVYVDQYWKG